ncbi:hypothetical protein GOV09_03920 [Candidatus Woesearchaeota archaeon]|nr:hypothetical protein [Candidatus Woesearchaeota archaeon]
MKLPESAEECFYFTNRAIDEKGYAKAFVLKPDCPKCGKAKMGKPIAKGKVKIRAKEYVCPACNYTVSKEEFEPTLPMNVIYTCPFCEHRGETTTPYKRKRFKKVDAYVFECDSCHEQVPITKKLKDIKEK